MTSPPRAQVFGVDWTQDLPAHWRLDRLGRHAQVVNGYPFDSERFNSSTGIPIVRIRDLLRGWTSTYYNGPVIQEALVHNGDMLIGMDGDFTLVLWQGGTALLNQRLCCIRPAASLDERFLFHVLGRPLGIINDLTWFTTVKHLLTTDVARVQIPIPPIAEQQVISAFLDRETADIDAVVEWKHRLIDLLRERRGAVVDRTARRGLESVPFRESGVEWLGHVPEHWETRPLITTVTAVQNGTWGDEPTGTPTDVACVRVADFDRLRLTVQDRELTQRSVASDEFARHCLRPGDLLLEKSGGGDVQPVGKVVLFDRPVDAVCSNFVARLSIRSEHDPRYCAYLHDVLYRSRVNVRSIKQSTGLQNLDSDSYLRELVCIPPLEEQRSIADYIDHETAELDRLVTSIREQISKLQERRAALITAAVTGQLDIRSVA